MGNFFLMKWKYPSWKPYSLFLISHDNPDWPREAQPGQWGLPKGAGMGKALGLELIWNRTLFCPSGPEHWSKVQNEHPPCQDGLNYSCPRKFPWRDSNPQHLRIWPQQGRGLLQMEVCKIILIQWTSVPIKGGNLETCTHMHTYEKPMQKWRQRLEWPEVKRCQRLPASCQKLREIEPAICFL